MRGGQEKAGAAVQQEEGHLPPHRSLRLGTVFPVDAQTKPMAQCWWEEGRSAKGQALSLRGGSPDSKTLDHQRTCPGEHQVVRTHTKERPLECTTWHHPCTSSTPCGTPRLNSKQKASCRQQTGLPPHSASPSGGRTDEKLGTSFTPRSLHRPRDPHRRAETKGKEELSLGAWEKATSDTVSRRRA